MVFIDNITTILGVTVFVILVIRLYIKITQRFAPVENCAMEGRTIIVTGGSNGIGKATVKLLAAKRARVVIACRNVEKGAATRDEIIAATGYANISVKKLDLSSLRSIRNFVNEFKQEEHRLDVLINNAGILAPARKTITEDGLELTYATNHFGPFLLTNLLLDFMKQSGPGRIINVTSVVYAMGNIDFDNLCAERSYSSYTIYGHTKLANILFTRELSKRLEGTGITVNCLHPGTVRTSLLNYRPELKIISFIFGSLFWKDPEVGAQTSLYLAVSGEVNGVTGQYFDNCRPVVPSAKARDDGVARKLWEVSEKLTGLIQ
ncbi:retinol dehydrogenase 14-like isoform X1 [Lytechinus variegatus]|uniref:retinol dehydrogenase 14-like isoform X1 n=1 Tax=Lytechinus variegatus TaxID=7654 RepID=UPI001BB13B9B|nr:retinol dehydrogenase 14-like isoform X1 [Lytechinus variegatus]